MPDQKLNGRRAIVCGSTQGIGRAIAELFAENGAAVTLMARDQAKLAELAGSLPSKGTNHTYIAVDFNDAGAVERAIDDNKGIFEHATILVNNSGGPPGGLIHEADPSEFRLAFERHLIVSHLLVNAVKKSMIRNEFGRIINIISTSVKSPIPGLGVSNTIRGAVASWAKTLANELGPYGITVNNVLPGATATARLESIIENKASKTRQSAATVREEMISEIPARRFAEPSEIAAAVLFLCGSDASYVNGINLPVDGGRLSCL